MWRRAQWVTEHSVAITLLFSLGIRKTSGFEREILCFEKSKIY